MTPELEGLLALQRDDDVVDALVARLTAVAPRLAALETARAVAERLVRQTEATVAEDERRQREIEGRLTDHKTRQEKNLQHLDAVKRMREATAAMLQVEAGKKIILDEQNELRALSQRVADGHAAIARHQRDLEALDESQAAERKEIDAERAGIEAELHAARTDRDATAVRVQGVLLMKYDKIRARRRAQAVFALADGACGACDTAVPAQRRNLMSAKGRIEVCEGCGVLLYAAE